MTVQAITARYSWNISRVSERVKAIIIIANQINSIVKNIDAYFIGIIISQNIDQITKYGIWQMTHLVLLLPLSNNVSGIGAVG